MKRNTILKATLALSLMGALVLAGGCKSMGGKDDVKCPSCGKTTSTFNPKTGRTYHKVECPMCKTVTTIDPATGVASDAHVCDTCGMLIEKCPKCKNM